MQKNDVLRCGESIVRVLEVHENQALIVTYPRKSVPMWINQEELKEYQPFKEEEIPSFPPEFEELSPDQRRIAHERYTLIAGILPFIGDERQRCTLIARMSAEFSSNKKGVAANRRFYAIYSGYPDEIAVFQTAKSRDEWVKDGEESEIKRIALLIVFF